MRFSDLTEDQWEYIKCFLPSQPKVVRKRAEDRRTIKAASKSLRRDVNRKICPNVMRLMLQLGEG